MIVSHAHIPKPYPSPVYPPPSTKDINILPSQSFIPTHSCESVLPLCCLWIFATIFLHTFKSHIERNNSVSTPILLIDFVHHAIL